MTPSNMTPRIIDTHFHMWDLDCQELPWLADCPDISKTYAFAQYVDVWRAIEQECGVEFAGGIYVEVDGIDPVQEDELVWRAMEGEEKLLAACMRTKVEPLMRVPGFAAGIREPLHVPSEPVARCLEPSFLEGLSMLGDHNYLFEACIRVEELNDIALAAQKVPGCTFVVNHVGNVCALDQWDQRAMEKLAALDNVYLKVSGYPTGDHRVAREILSRVRATFNPSKLLFASNWPVILLYGDLRDHVRLCQEAFGDDAGFWADNARACYRLR